MNPEGGDMMTVKPAQDPYQVRDMVIVEITKRFEALIGGLNSLVDWAENTKHLNNDDVTTLTEMRKTLMSLNEAFNERNAPMAENVGPPPSTGL